jgi:hypothetical protein
MARKLYIFGIGGTGSRVIKALAMLLASGVRLEKGFDVVVPIIIDPDISNGDLNRTKDILRLYQEIRNQVDHPDDFFYQEIRTIAELSGGATLIKPDNFQFLLNDTNASSFRQYIGFDNLSSDLNEEDDKSFVRSLYSGANLDSSLNVGFKGNPNMGSIVLNQFTNSEDFRKFGQSFGNDDAVFIINSIFGGTGAAGFPLLLKNLRGNIELPRHSIIKESKIGGLTYLPYFSLDKEDEISAKSFEEKAKIAIDYYNRTIISTNSINTLYLVGNRGSTNQEEYAVGGQEQKNRAHFLELAGALAIMDFCKNIESAGVPTQVKEFGIEKDTDSVSFGDLNLGDAKAISSHLTKFRLFTEYLNKGLSRALRVSRWTKSNIWLLGRSGQSPLDANYFRSPEYTNQIRTFNNYFDEWISEMGQNKPSFAPFIEVTDDSALSLVKNRLPKGDRSFKSLDTHNCMLIDDLSLRSRDKKHTTLIRLFGKSTQKVLQSKDVLI